MEKQTTIRGSQNPCEANLNRHVLGQTYNLGLLKMLMYSLMANWYHPPPIKKSWMNRNHKNGYTPDHTLVVNFLELI